MDNWHLLSVLNIVSCESWKKSCMPQHVLSCSNGGRLVRGKKRNRWSVASDEGLHASAWPASVALRFYAREELHSPCREGAVLGLGRCQEAELHPHKLAAAKFPGRVPRTLLSLTPPWLGCTHPREKGNGQKEVWYSTNLPLCVAGSSCSCSRWFSHTIYFTSIKLLASSLSHLCHNSSLSAFQEKCVS